MRCNISAALVQVAATSIQKCFKVHAAHRRMKRRRQGADQLKEFLNAAKKSSGLKVSINKFRLACVTIQRFWRAKEFKKAAELVNQWEPLEPLEPMAAPEKISAAFLNAFARQNC